MKRNYELFLKDIKQAIEDIFKFTEGMKFNDFKNDKKTIYAVTRCFIIIGEAVSYLPESFKTKHNEIEWKDVKDFRNIIVHKYWGIEIKDEWDIIKGELDNLLKKIINL
jgi:uncharacterized protein with HEPN domain